MAESQETVDIEIEERGRGAAQTEVRKFEGKVR